MNSSQQVIWFDKYKKGYLPYFLKKTTSFLGRPSGVNWFRILGINKAFQIACIFSMNGSNIDTF
jgi:hypothetical protein